MEFNLLNTGFKIFMPSEVKGGECEDPIEKYTAEQGLMPVLEDEAGAYGFTDKKHHMVEYFRKDETPMETFHIGLAVVEILMGLYRSAKISGSVIFLALELENYVPVFARTEA